jgi:hypothetical protein
MSRLTDKEKAALERFDHLPDTAAVPLKICSIISGISDRTWRDKPPIPTFHISEHKRAANAGMLRKLVRGELTSAAIA